MNAGFFGKLGLPPPIQKTPQKNFKILGAFHVLIKNTFTPGKVLNLLFSPPGTSPFPIGGGLVVGGLIINKKYGWGKNEVKLKGHLRANRKGAFLDFGRDVIT